MEGGAGPPAPGHHHRRPQQAVPPGRRALCDVRLIPERLDADAQPLARGAALRRALRGGCCVSRRSGAGWGQLHSSKERWRRLHRRCGQRKETAGGRCGGRRGSPVGLRGDRSVGCVTRRVQGAEAEWLKLAGALRHPRTAQREQGRLRCVRRVPGAVGDSSSGGGREAGRPAAGGLRCGSAGCQLRRRSNRRSVRWRRCVPPHGPGSA